MSLLLRRLRLKKHVLARRYPLSLLLSSGFSSSSLQSPPCSIIAADPCGEGLGKLVIRNVNEHSCTHLEKKVPLELVYNHLNAAPKTVTIGASHGWVATLKDDGILRLQDDLNPHASYTDPKRIPLPPLVTMRHSQTKIITNVSMSSSSPEDDKDCVVAVKFFGPQLSFCRSSQSKPGWANIKIQNTCFYSSGLMYSKKNKMFRIPGSGGHLIGSWDPCKPNDNPKLQTLQFQNLPKLPTATRELFNSCCTSEYLVESPDGETFLVKLYRKTSKIIKGIAKMKTKGLMVFNIDKEGNAVYTKDIGDLVIFLSKSEPFCVPATSFPDMRSNHVEFLEDFNETAYIDLSGHPFISYIDTGFPSYYIPPQNIDK